MHTGVFDTLQSEGFFYDPVRKEVEDLFLADVVSNVSTQVDAYNAAQELGLEMIKNAIKSSKEFGKEAVMLRRLYFEKLAKEEAARKAAAEEAARKAAEEAAAAEGGEGEEE